MAEHSNLVAVERLVAAEAVVARRALRLLVLAAALLAAALRVVPREEAAVLRAVVLRVVPREEAVVRQVVVVRMVPREEEEVRREAELRASVVVPVEAMPPLYMRPKAVPQPRAARSPVCCISSTSSPCDTATPHSVGMAPCWPLARPLTPRVSPLAVGLAEAVAPLQAASVAWVAHLAGLVVMVAQFRKVAAELAAPRLLGPAVVAQVVWAAPAVSCLESAAEPVASPPPESVAAGEAARVAWAAPVVWARLAGRPSAVPAALGEASGMSGIS